MSFTNKYCKKCDKITWQTANKNTFKCSECGLLV